MVLIAQLCGALDERNAKAPWQRNETRPAAVDQAQRGTPSMGRRVQHLAGGRVATRHRERTQSDSLVAAGTQSSFRAHDLTRRKAGQRGSLTSPGPFLY